jgi:hypothetical protein
VESDPGLTGHIRDARKGGTQVAFHIHGQGFEGAEIDDPAALGLVGGAVQHEPVQAPEKCGQRLAAARRSKNQGILAARDRRPAEPLRCGRMLEDSPKPGRRHGVKEVQSVPILFLSRHSLLHQG